MNWTSATYLGIDVSSSRPFFSFAALDADLHILAEGSGRLDDITAFAAGQSEAVAAVCAPSSPVSQALPSLRALGLALPRPVRNPASPPTWMQRGLILYQHLHALGYHPYPAEDSPRVVLETNAEACFWAWAGVAPLPARSLEGRLQRLTLLEDQDLPVEDSMKFFEEITRHRLMRGQLAWEMVPQPGELNALAAARTAWLAVRKPERLTWLESVAVPANPLPRPPEEPERLPLPTLFPLSED